MNLPTARPDWRDAVHTDPPGHPRTLAIVIAVYLATLAAIATVLLSGCQPIEQKPAHEPSKSTTRCQEDEPCWDCRVMGNKKCERSELRA